MATIAVAADSPTAMPCDLFWPSWKPVQILLEFRIERGGKRGIQSDENVVCGLICGRPCRGRSRHMWETHCVRMVRLVNRVYRVENGGMQHGETSRRVKGRRLRARRTQNHQQSPVPFNDRIYRWHWRARRQPTDRSHSAGLRGLQRESREEQGEDFCVT